MVARQMRLLLHAALLAAIARGGGGLGALRWRPGGASAEPAPARTVEFYQAGSPGVADIEFFVEEDDPPNVHEPMTYDEVMRRRRPANAPAPAASDLVPAWLSNYWS